MLPDALVYRSEEDTQRRSVAQRIDKVQKDRGAVDHDRSRRLRHGDALLVHMIPHFYRDYMRRGLSIISKNNYHEENILFVLFVFFNKNVDNSVDKWNNSRVTHRDFNTFFIGFLSFHSFP